MKVASIYVFGDSLVAGTYDSQGGWCDRLKRDMHRLTQDATDGTKRQMYNLGIGGETSRGLAARIKPELAARHSAAWPAVVIIATGKNDSRLTNGQPEVAPEEYQHNLETSIAAAREVTDKVLLVGMGPCAKAEVTFKTYTYTRERLREYNAICTKTAQRLDVPKVDVFEQILAADPAQVFYRDGLHLSDEGYEIVYQAVKPALLNSLEG
ncbi:MAG: peptidase [Patescibacteria group bacterium]|nr:peptidase [Patescibacteria group bacterium]